MKDFLEFEGQQEPLLEDTFIDLRYDHYCQLLEAIANDDDLDALTEGVLDFVRGTASRLASAFKSFKKELQNIAKQFRISIRELVLAFKNKNIWSILKLFGFQLQLLLKTLMTVTGWWRESVMGIFAEMAETGLMQKVQKGIVKADEIIDRYPILKRITGLAAAALIFYIWLNMTFIGDLEYDFDFTSIVQALSGNFTLESIFGGPAGIMLGTLFFTGAYVSVPWIGTTVGNLILAIVYTGFVYVRGNSDSVTRAIKNKIKTVRIKVRNVPNRV